MRKKMFHELPDILQMVILRNDIMFEKAKKYPNERLLNIYYIKLSKLQNKKKTCKL